MGEEHGLHGSKAYVKAHGDELDSIVAVINVDMPGEPRGLVTFGHAEVVPFLQRFACDLPGYVISDEVHNSSGEWSDHAPFMKAGICAVSLWGELGEGVRFYHTHGDTYDQVDLHATNSAAAALAVLARRFADAVPAPTKRLSPEEIDSDEDS
jgi:Zn-dependent M28 family amino/carboxypeptidase